MERSGQGRGIHRDARAEVVSGRLTLEQLEAELPHVADELRRLGAERVRVEYWTGRAEVAVSALVPAFAEGFENGHFGTPQTRERLVTSDFRIYADGLRTEFEFCHEYELHVTSDDGALLGRFRSRWQSLGYKAR